MLRKNLALLFALALTPAAVGAPHSGLPQGAQWRQIVPMQSTRDDVERLLGKYEETAHVIYYSIREGSVQVEYSTGFCRPDQEVGWDVPEWTVVGMDYIPFKSPPSASRLGLDLTKLRKLPDKSMHISESDVYRDDEAAIEYWVRDDGTVVRFVYSPAKRYDHLLCEKKNASQL